MAEHIGNWQKTLDDFLRCTLETGGFEKFKCLESNKERLQFVFNQNLLQNVEWLKVYLDNCDLINKKNSVRAVEFKTTGNGYFKKKDYTSAINAYTESVLNAPVDKGTDLSLAYGNRSAALFYLQKYEECVKDIGLAIEAGFPQESVYKLYIRRTQCYLHLHDIERAELELKKTIKLVESLKDILDAKKHETIQKEIEGLRNSTKVTNASKSFPENTDTKVSPQVSYGINTVITQASSCLELKYTQQQGRFIVSNQDIQIGDTLIIEKPFSAVLLPNHYTTHCHHCYHKLPVNIIGCDKCTIVRYCSTNCKEDSWRSYHSIECLYLDLLHSVGIAHLSLRTVLIAGLQYLKGFLKEKEIEVFDKESPTNIKGLNDTGQYERSYNTVYHLMTHETKILPEDLYQYSVTAGLLLIILLHSGWFNQSGEEQLPSCSKNISAESSTIFHPSTQSNSSNDNNAQNTNDLLERSVKSNGDSATSEILSNEKLGTENLLANGRAGNTGLLTNEILDIGSVLLRHIEQLVCNAHAITEVQCTDELNAPTVFETSQVRIATAIYPTASLMNHSCDPTIISSFHGDTLIVKSIKNVKKGDEIFNCYGPHQKRMVRKRRQEILSNQYFFHCECLPCSEQRSGDVQFNAGICSECAGSVDTLLEQPVCIDCGRVEDITSRDARAEIDSLLQQGVTLLLQHSNAQEALKILQKCKKLCCKYLNPNNVCRASVDDSLARCYVMLGNNEKAIQYLQNSIKVTEVMYGLDSIEVAHELQKLADILFNAKKPEEALNIINRASKIFILHYGEDHDTVKELDEMKECLIDFIGAENIKQLVL